MFLAFGIYVLIYLFDDITKSHSTNLQEQPGHFFFHLKSKTFSFLQTFILAIFISIKKM